jgi:hypothetical protein
MSHYRFVLSSERSYATEGSLSLVVVEMLRFAQHDMIPFNKLL